MERVLRVTLESDDLRDVFRLLRDCDILCITLCEVLEADGTRQVIQADFLPQGAALPG